jgi:hypothetical protein
MTGRATKFKAEWMERKDEPAQKYSTWLTADLSDILQATCKVCNKCFHLVTSGFRAVTSHTEGKKHKGNVLRANTTSTPSITFFSSSSSLLNVDSRNSSTD